MPSIFGIVARSAQGSNNALLTQMLAAAPGREVHTCDQQASDQAGLAVTQRTPQGGIARSEGYWLAFAGQILEDDDFETRLSRLPVQTPEGFCERLLAMYIYLGVEALQGLNGQYALAIWEERTQRMLLLNDRLGLQPFYFWRGPHEFLFASQLKAFTAYPAFSRQVNPLALADLLASGQMLGEHTLFSGVRALPPASLLLFEAGYLLAESYAELPLFKLGWSDPDPQNVIEFLDVTMQAAVRQRVTNGSRLLLTGGLDSRLLAGYMGECKDRENLSAATISQPRSRDVQLAREVAEKAGLAHHIVPVNPGYLRDYAARCVQVTDGSMNVHAAWIFHEEADLAANPAQAVLTGVGGEGLSGRHVLSELKAQSEQQALDWLFNQHWQFAQASSLLRPELRPAIEESKACLARALQESPFELLDSRLDDFHYRVMRRSPTGNLLNPIIKVQEPYFDHDLLDFTLGLPPGLRAGGKLFNQLLKMRFPALAEIPGSQSEGDSTGALQRAWRKVDRRLGRSLSFLSGSPLGDDPARPIYANHWMRTDSQPYIRGLLARGDLLGDFFDMRAVRRLLDEHMSGRSDAYRLLGALVTFAEWRQQVN